MKARWGVFTAFVVAAVVFSANAARWLMIDQPAPSDAILVLAGETDARPSLGLRLLDKSYAPILILDVPAEQRIYGWTALELVQQWIRGLPESAKIFVCPIHGLSTKAESREAELCLNKVSAHRVLLVTSDFHTRRALSTFRHEAPRFSFAIAAAPGGQEFGVRWWQHREWAKTTLYEWMRLVWWEAVDRWR